MRGSTVILEIKDIVGENDFGAPITSSREEEVKDVLVGTPTSEDVTDALNMYGKKISYVLGIPKGDLHEWENRDVWIFGKKYRTVGNLQTCEQDNIPLRWGATIKVEKYE